MHLKRQKEVYLRKRLNFLIIKINSVVLTSKIMKLTDIFTTEELKNKVCCLYDTIQDGAQFEIEFENLFNMPYQLIFGNISIEDCIWILLQNYYQNEYFVKNSFRERCLKNNHLFFEFSVCDSRADIVSVGKHTHCYEIKTQYDNLDRLKKQICDYSKVFEYISVVCSDDKVSEVREMIPEYCGIISYKKRKNATFVEIRKAKLSINREAKSILNCFKLVELRECFGSTERDNILKDYSIACIEENFKTCLRKRFSLY